MRNKNDYHEDWTDKIRPQVLKFYDYKCIDCGIKHKVYVAVKKGKQRVQIDKDEIADYTTNGWKCYRIYLHVCHEDNDKTNNDMSNLKPRCVTHHAVRDGQYKAILRLSNTKKKTRLQLNLLDEIEEQEKQQQQQHNKNNNNNNTTTQQQYNNNNTNRNKINNHATSIADD